jgi:hypothetical protein
VEKLGSVQSYVLSTDHHYQFPHHPHQYHQQQQNIDEMIEICDSTSTSLCSNVNIKKYGIVTSNITPIVITDGHEAFLPSSSSSSSSSSLNHYNNQYNHNYHSNGLIDHQIQWFDDHELNEKSAEQIEEVMDSSIMMVVKQLVQLASIDDDLKAEIDSLDASGFSLLHYCCIYNLTALIPVLLGKGADVNKRCASGSTSLHLAASAGHKAVVQLLLSSHANVGIRG